MVDHRPALCDMSAMSTEAPISSSALPDVRAKKGRIVGVLAAIAVLAGGGVGGVVWYQNKTLADNQAKAHGTLVKCLFGDDALRPGERPSSRFRRIQLTALSTDPL